MHPVKQAALEAIGKLPEDVNMEEIMYRLYVLDKIRNGQEAVERGRRLTNDELKREIDSWQSGLKQPSPIFAPFTICNYSVPLFGKEGLAETFLNKSPSIPLFQRGK